MKPVLSSDRSDFNPGSKPGNLLIKPQLTNPLPSNPKDGNGTENAPQFTTLPPLALYVHIPWCERKCPYCDFNSHPRPYPHNSHLPEKDYIAALLADLDNHLPQIWGRTLSTIFIGGGTPSLFSEAGIESLLSQIRQRLPFNDLTEVTLEANPGTLEQNKLPGFRRAGVNRLSLGIQSFNDRALQRLGRIHDATQARRAIEAADSAGFDSFNIDLMFGLPEQTHDETLSDLHTALAFNPPHLSLYQLTLESNTAFARQPPRLPDADQVAGMQSALHDCLDQAGLQQYEVSAFARGAEPDNGTQVCRHNVNYWQFGDYVGIGAGAHSKISLPDRITRLRNIKDPVRYLQAARSKSPQTLRTEKRQLSSTEAVFEFMLNTMRLRDGVPLALFAAHTGLPLTQLLTRADTAQQQGLLTLTGQRIQPTDLGHRFLDNLTELFLP